MSRTACNFKFSCFQLTDTHAKISHALSFFAFFRKLLQVSILPKNSREKNEKEGSKKGENRKNMGQIEGPKAASKIQPKSRKSGRCENFEKTRRIRKHRKTKETAGRFHPVSFFPKFGPFLLVLSYIWLVSGQRLDMQNLALSELSFLQYSLDEVKEESVPMKRLLIDRSSRSYSCQLCFETSVKVAQARFNVFQI